MSITHATIVGAGVAGLTTALSLAAKGISSDIIEQAPQLGEVGAGLQLSPNATRVLSALGVLSDIEKHWLEPRTIRLASGRDLRSLADLPAGKFARDRWGAPYGVLHRSTLQQALLRAVLNQPLCKLHLGRRIDGVGAEALAHVTGRRPDLVVGADGAWSVARDAVPGSPTVSFSGNIAWRFTISSAAAPGFLSRSGVTAHLGPRAHLVSYPLNEIDGFNLVAIAAGTRSDESWALQADAARRAMLLDQFSGWHRDIRTVLAGADNPTFWPLYQASEGLWQNGSDTVLIGDAAHAMMPFSAQGAAMAIEDAFSLAHHVSKGALPAALARFETERKARAARVKARGDFNRFAYHARGPFRIGRDIVLSLRSPESLAADLDWLYGHKIGD
ncbi:salicylate hydroxylase [Rhizobium sp. Root274]|uniref:FAD-dependent monooxygenase n=1 Tax=unclassified Rhizobium TaxID=2613769 RepID=UPI0007147B88|nr:MULTISPECIES: FAD-dependent monooxygenase [unclassified Rhizobium]KQW27551.1 salicylate hydroxylase [Rhizobium sp. Root1240]KRD27789.1 salicylate hydroxylase [Rhizobium sp. Root274]